MQRLLDFIEHNLHLILFAVLQLGCAFLIFGLNPFQQAAFTNMLSGITSSSNQISADITSYLGLKEENRLLQDQVASQFRRSDIGTVRYMNDTIAIKDSSKHTLYDITPAEVIYNTSYKAKNVFIINKGTLHGISKNMGVISSEGLAGVVLKAGKEYSTVMSLLNTNMTVIPNINGQEYYTKLEWDNQIPNTMKVSGINMLEEIEVGDVVQTGKSSLLFPEGIKIGEVLELNEVENSQYFNTRIKTATNFRNLDYVYVVINKQAQILEELLEE